MWCCIVERTSFSDFDGELGKGDEAHRRSYDERGLNPWVVIFQLLEGCHDVSLRDVIALSLCSNCYWSMFDSDDCRIYWQIVLQDCKSS